MKRAENYCLVLTELLEVMKMGEVSPDGLFDAMALVFDYGKAKGYRAAKAERRAAV